MGGEGMTDREKLDWLLSIKVTVWDRGALSAVSMATLERYLREHEWRHDGLMGCGSHWLYNDGGGEIEVVVSKEDGLLDHAIRMGEALANIAQAEVRSQLAIMADLMDLQEEVNSDQATGR
jgi:hypothetical protein